LINNLIKYLNKKLAKKKFKKCFFYFLNEIKLKKKNERAKMKKQ
jgi:hypothetical protein